jgi:glutamate synthase domain-containing protein 3
VYDTYQNDLAKLNDRTIKLIQDYAKNYKTMTDETAQKLLDEYMAIEGDRLKLRESYRPQFMKVLPAKRVARFYQLENKIHAVVSYDLARQIPLIK